MKRCRAVRFLFRIIPFAGWRWALLEGHVRDCPDCGKEAAGPGETAAAMIPRPDDAETPDFWPAFAERLAREGRSPVRRLRPSWRFAAAAAGLAALAGVLAVFAPRAERPLADAPFKVENLKLYDGPGRAIIFQGRDPDKTFVWVEKQ